jgi:hypothetical protein
MRRGNTAKLFVIKFEDLPQRREDQLQAATDLLKQAAIKCMTNHVASCPECAKPGFAVLEYKSCGKSNCRCYAGKRHGPYVTVQHHPSRSLPITDCHIKQSDLHKIDRQVLERLGLNIEESGEVE